MLKEVFFIVPLMYLNTNLLVVVVSYFNLLSFVIIKIDLELLIIVLC
jgi:hypothetical protein